MTCSPIDPYSCWPGSCSQSGDPGLEDSQEEGEGVFPCDDKINAGQEDCAVDDQTNNHSHHVHAKLPGHHLQVLNGDDLATNQTGNTKGRVPYWVRNNLLLLWN